MRNLNLQRRHANQPGAVERVAAALARRRRTDGVNGTNYVVHLSRPDAPLTWCGLVRAQVNSYPTDYVSPYAAPEHEEQTCRNCIAAPKRILRRLTAAQQRVLLECAEPSRNADGTWYWPRRNWKTLDALVELGLIKCPDRGGWGADGSAGYAITRFGRIVCGIPAHSSSSSSSSSSASSSSPPAVS